MGTYYICRLVYREKHFRAIMFRRLRWIPLFLVLLFLLSGDAVVTITTDGVLPSSFSITCMQFHDQSVLTGSVVESDSEPLENNGCLDLSVVVFLDFRPVRSKGLAVAARQVSLHGVLFFPPIAGVTSLPDMKQLFGDETRWITLKSLLC